MELLGDLFNNDLLRIVVAYTTPGVSLDLLASFAPRETYSDTVWRTKTLVESKGLIVDNSVIQMVGDGRWYAYYLSQNTTYCGNVLEVKWHRGGVKSNIVGTQLVVYYEVIVTSDSDTHPHRITIQQFQDLSIKIKNKKVRGINRRIRQVVYAEQPLDALLILDEIGDVWVYNVSSSSLEDEPMVADSGIVAMHITDYHTRDAEIFRNIRIIPLLLLNRQGQLKYLRKDEYIASPKVISFIQYRYSNMVSLSNGKIITVSRDQNKWEYATDVHVYGHSIRSDYSVLNGFITTKLRPVIDGSTDVNNKVVQYSYNLSSSAYLTTDRTAYIRIKPSRNDDVSELVIEQSIYRTQSVMLIQPVLLKQNKARYLIIDPIDHH